MKSPKSPYRDVKVKWNYFFPGQHLRVFDQEAPSVSVNEHFRRRFMLSLVPERSSEEIYRKAVQEQIAFENFSLNYPMLEGTVIVNNVAYEKDVKVRLSTTRWYSYHDISASYKEKVATSIGDLDRFCFQFDVSQDFVENGNLSLAVNVSFNKGDRIWDNLNGRNYSAKLLVESLYSPTELSQPLKIEPTTQPAEPATQSKTHQSAPLSPKQRSSKNASVNWFDFNLFDSIDPTKQAIDKCFDSMSICSPYPLSITAVGSRSADLVIRLQPNGKFVLEDVPFNPFNLHTSPYQNYSYKTNLFSA